MIVELIGPGGVGKTTVEPLVADRLGILYYEGRKRHGFQGEPLTGRRLWSSRLGAVIRAPRLSLAAMTTDRGTARERAWFVMDITRREGNASKAARLGSGVLASGPIHALCMMSGSTGADVTPLVAQVTKADVYVRLGADPAEVTRRLAGRLGAAADDLDRHHEWMATYNDAATRLFERLDRPLLEVDAGAGPELVADEIARLLKPYLD